MNFLEIIEEKIVGKKINIEKISLIEIEDSSGLHCAIHSDFKEKYALITDVYSVFDYSEFNIGVHAYIDDKIIFFTLSDTDDIEFEVERF